MAGHSEGEIVAKRNEVDNETYNSEAEQAYYGPQKQEPATRRSAPSKHVRSMRIWSFENFRHSVFDLPGIESREQEAGYNVIR